MKHLLPFISLLCIICLLCGCGSSAPANTPAADSPAAEEPAPNTGNPAADPETAPEPEAEQGPDAEQGSDTESDAEPAGEAAPQRTEPFTIVFQGVSMIPGQVFDDSRLSAPDFVEETPDCRDDSIMLHVEYEDILFAVKTNAEGVSVLNSITLESPMVRMPEGIGLGSDRSEVEAAYGTDYEEAFGSCIYTAGGTTLTVVYNDADQVTYVVLAAAD